MRTRWGMRGKGDAEIGWMYGDLDGRDVDPGECEIGGRVGGVDVRI